MRLFRCETCGHPLHFENVRCLHCGSDLAFLPDRLALCAIEPAPDEEGLWRRKRPQGRPPARRRYRLCVNHTEHQACNFAVRADDGHALCVSCRQTSILPDLSLPENPKRWYRIESAKRRLFYTLAELGLVPVLGDARSDGPVFQFLADNGSGPVMTGHCNGVITLNVAEADDTERVRRRVELHEPYRTLLGHLRHESGHFYWDRLIRDDGRIDDFRALFGDETLDYGQALATHYAAGGHPADWQEAFVSAYATAHPWEDWAETWAHYLHMVDLLETAASYNTRLVVPGTGVDGSDEEAEEVDNPFESETRDFDHLVEQWVPVTLLLNSLNRSLGQDDAYPFALTAGALKKLRFVHDVIHAPRPGEAQAPQAPTTEPAATAAPAENG